MAGLKIHAPLQTRVGIATGLVVVGDLIGSGAAQERAVVGETPNLAARLQGLAEPNSAGHRREHAAADRRMFDLRISGHSNSPALPSRSAPGWCSARAAR